MAFDELTQTTPTAPLTGDIGGKRPEPGTAIDPARQIGPVVAHDLNNILAIVQGYADRLLLRHATNPALMPDLKLISEAAKRAATVIRTARQAQAQAALGQSNPPPAAGV